MASPLKTPLCELLGIEVPILSAGMAFAASTELTAAVSNAGGLGVMGNTGDSPEELRKKINRVRELTDKPFGVDLLLPKNVDLALASISELSAHIPQAHRDYVDDLRTSLSIAPSRADTVDEEVAARHALGTGAKEQLEVVFEEKVPVFVSGLGSPGHLVSRARAQGMKVIGIVGNVKNARRVAADGVDAIIAQGADGGGHTGRVGTFSLLPQAVDAVHPLPLIAAGGISDGRSLAAALAFGCQGVWVGTRFLATPEADIAQWRKDSLVAADDESTRISRSYTGKPARLISNAWMEAWERGDIKPLPMPLQDVLVRPALEADRDNPDIQPNASGQGVGLIHEILPAGEIVAEMARVAEKILGGR